MPEINKNTNNIAFGKLGPHKVKKVKEEETQKPAGETKVVENLNEDYNATLGRAMVHSTSLKEEKALKARVNKYAQEFLNDSEKATLYMDFFDTFKNSGMVFEEATDATDKLIQKLGKDKIESYKEIPGMGQYVADICTSFMKKFDWDLDKSIDMSVKVLDTVSGR